MKAKILLFTFAILCIGLISGCANDDFEEITGVCPVVVSTSPVTNALNVPLGQIITVAFNEEMDPSSITSTTFMVVGAAPVAGTVTYDGTAASFKPTLPLAENTTYTARITTKAKDLMGNFLQADYVWTFSTGILLRPVVIATDPINNAVAVKFDKTITATFNMPMNPSTLNATTFKVNQGVNAVVGAITYTGLQFLLFRQILYWLIKFIR